MANEKAAPKKGYRRMPKKRCACCGLEKSELQHYYKSTLTSHSDRLLPICDDCILEQSLNDSKDDIDFRRFDEVLMQCNRPLRRDVWNMVKGDSRALADYKTGKERVKSLIGIYFQKLNSLIQYKNMTYKDGNFWDDAPEDQEPEDDEPEEEQVILIDKNYFLEWKEYCDVNLYYALCYLFNYYCNVVYGLKNDEEKQLLADYILNRAIQNIGIGANDYQTYKEAKNSADNVLIALKAMRGTPQDEEFLDAISGDLDTEGADDD